MGIPLVRGRDFDQHDSKQASGVALVSEGLAQRFWPGTDPLGRRLKVGGPEGPWRSVVGVVGDVRHHGLQEQPRLQVYLPHAQLGHSTMAVVVRSSGSAVQAAGVLRDAVAAEDPDAPVSGLRSGPDLVQASVADRRFASRLLAGFAFAAIGLVAIGLVGSLGQVVSQRTREIGVRLVLGARRAQVLALLLRHGLAPALLGLAAGLAVAPVAGRALAPLLFEVSPSDPPTLATAALGLALTAAAACVIPARRAFRVDPAVVLRGE
jgi:putative ABC transport system permease protein